MSSYSALILRLEGSSAPLAESGQDEAAQEIAEDIRHSLATPASAVGAARLGDLPTGPASGVFIHSLLEWMAQEGFATLAAQPSRLRDRVARGCALRQWEALIEPLSRQLEAWLHTPLGLPGQAVTLAQLEHYQPELEFWFAAHQLPLARLDQQVQRMLLPGQPRPQLRTDRLNGMLKGFVDLVLCHEGRYYVVDYKTNFLGPRLSDYGAEALTAPLAEARYDLQAALYLLALHRHLRERLPDYDCTRHLGGAVYLFLRGWDGAGQGVWHACPDAAQIHALDALFAGQPLPGANHADL
jgi:exodeoxyribonuclease V beta subunit